MASRACSDITCGLIDSCIRPHRTPSEVGTLGCIRSSRSIHGRPVTFSRVFHHTAVLTASIAYCIIMDCDVHL